MKKETEKKLIKYLRNLIIRCMSVIIIFLLMAIISKNNSTYKDLLVSNIYEKNFSFTKIKKIYTKYLGGITPLEKAIEKEIPVFNEKLEYTEASIYHDGVKLTVTKNYLVPILQEGMVIYIGKKENYGNVVIIEGIDGIDIWYGFMEEVSVELYDYVEKSNYLGTISDTSLFLAYQKDGIFQDYKEYIE